jgi:hypothetical protein
LSFCQHLDGSNHLDSTSTYITILRISLSTIYSFIKQSVKATCDKS